MKSKKRYVKMPGNTVKIVIKRARPRIGICRICRAELKGIPKLSSNKLKNLAKSMKRPNRAYGGNLCSKCSREVIAQKVRE